MKKIFYCCTVLLLTLLTSCTDTNSEAVNVATDPDAVINQDSQLYTLLEQVANVNPDSTSISCVNVVYPIEVKLYNTNNEQLAVHSIPDDAYFSAFLLNLEDGLSLTLTYPITLTDPDNLPIVVNNNTELITALLTCTQQDLIAWASAIFAPINSSCTWVVGHSSGWEGSTAYNVGGYFTPNADGTLTYNYEGETYTGTWAFEVTTTGVMLSISLEGGNADIAGYWSNNPFPFTYSTESDVIGLSNWEGKTHSLVHQCEVTQTYMIGETGPAGGRVFYDKGSYSEGWRYMEIDMTQTDSLMQWGCDQIALNTTQTGIGKGLANSGKIKYYFDNLDNYYTNPVATCSDNADGTVATGYGLYINNGKQWFLPSKDELYMVYQNLGDMPVNNFGLNYYWSSTEEGTGTAWAIHLSSGETIPAPKAETGYALVRRVHYF